MSSFPTNHLAAMLLLQDSYEFAIRRSENNQFYWVFHNTRGNTEAVAVSELYTRKEGAMYSIDLLMKHAATAKVSDQT